jgi:hypothetical protein
MKHRRDVRRGTSGFNAPARLDLPFEDLGEQSER